MDQARSIDPDDPTTTTAFTIEQAGQEKTAYPTSAERARFANVDIADLCDTCAGHICVGE